MKNITKVIPIVLMLIFILGFIYTGYNTYITERIEIDNIVSVEYLDTFTSTNDITYYRYNLEIEYTFNGQLREDVILQAFSTNLTSEDIMMKVLFININKNTGDIINESFDIFALFSTIAKFAFPLIIILSIGSTIYSSKKNNKDSSSDSSKSSYNSKLSSNTMTNQTNTNNFNNLEITRKKVSPVIFVFIIMIFVIMLFTSFSNNAIFYVSSLLSFLIPVSILGVIIFTFVIKKPTPKKVVAIKREGNDMFMEYYSIQEFELYLSQGRFHKDTTFKFPSGYTPPKSSYSNFTSQSSLNKQQDKKIIDFSKDECYEDEKSITEDPFEDFYKGKK